ncbi:hypothetical protein G9272_05415 [Streptomyces asoensis]|uniref:Uncharacterized protein n=1 Tax=Streptomyces asoensis TaxID=249586 RepID=A0A6M4WHC5_9ACTN|nr:hypothetical protein G9272_05415 [Streptomyces asoensis]
MKVTGLSWGDHPWGDNDFTIGAGWDWFSVHLTDGRQYMLYFVRDTSGEIVETIGTHPPERPDPEPVPLETEHDRHRLMDQSDNGDHLRLRVAGDRARRPLDRHT